MHRCLRDVALVQRLARHSNLDLTVKYARLAPGAEAAAVELLPCLMGSPKGSPAKRRRG